MLNFALSNVTAVMIFSGL